MTPLPGLLWRWPDGRTHRLSEYEVRVGTCALPGPNSRPDMRVVSDGSPDPTDPLTRLWLDAQAPSADEVGRAARITLDLGAPARAEGLDEARAALAYADTYASGVLNGPTHGGELYPRELLARTVGVDRDHLRHALTVTDQLAGEVARLRAVVQAAIARADAAEARCDALEERLTTADVPWRVPGCQCPSDSKPGDRCDARWSRCSARITYLRAMKTTENL